MVVANHRAVSPAGVEATVPARVEALMQIELKRVVAAFFMLVISFWVL